MTEQEQIIKKKKKRLVRMFLEEAPEEKEEVITRDEMVKLIVKVFRHHIGNEQAIRARDLFVKIIGIAPEEMDVFRRNYWWNVIKTLLRQLRHENALFVVYKTGSHKLFVLQSKEELVYVKKRADQSIANMEKVKKNATEWYKQEKWRNL